MSAFVTTSGLSSFGVITAAGVLGTPLFFFGGLGAPSNHTIDWSNAGTAATTCSLRMEGSSDGVHWFDMTGPLDGTVTNMVHIVNKPLMYVRLFVISYTSADGTTAVNVRYTRGK
jgi:hypothetical protein